MHKTKLSILFSKQWQYQAKCTETRSNIKYIYDICWRLPCLPMQSGSNTEEKMQYVNELLFTCIGDCCQIQHSGCQSLQCNSHWNVFCCSEIFSEEYSVLQYVIQCRLHCSNEPLGPWYTKAGHFAYGNLQYQIIYFTVCCSDVISVSSDWHVIVLTSGRDTQVSITHRFPGVTWYYDW